MCGIAGFFGKHVADPAVAQAMKEEIRRRGPDAQHIVTWDASLKRCDSGVANALISARLAIIDPRPLADQPMSNEAGDIWICYNGEVFDWAGHAEILRGQGAHFRTHSDTEFILRAYEAWGMDCLSRLRGMFAIAILDLRKLQVFLVRDGMGIKPLVYSLLDGELAFSSTVRGVLPYLQKNARGLAPGGIDAFLAHRYVPAPATIFNNISRLENGHYLRFDLATRELRKQRYWQPQASHENWLAALDQSLRVHTVADRPLGVFLSGGVDSSVVAARLAGQGYKEYQAFTAAFPGSAMDESVQAGEYAQALGLPHRAVDISYQLENDFGHIVADLDEPFADPSCVPTWYLSREAAREVKVVLGGDGGDELFAGYKRYAQQLKSAWRGDLSLPWLPLIPSPARRGFAKAACELSMSWHDAYALRFSGFTPNQRAWLQPDFSLHRMHYWRTQLAPADASLASLIAIDMDNYLPEYILRKGDLCTMAHGLELRVPLLDQMFYQSVLGLPDRERFTRPPKALLANALSPLQQTMVMGRKKRGFNPPLTEWLRKDLASRLPELGVRLQSQSHGQLAAARVSALVNCYLAGTEAYAEQVLQLLILDESLRQLAATA